MSPMLMRIIVPISLVLLLAAVSEAGLLHDPVDIEVTNAVSNRKSIYIEITNALSDNRSLELRCYERYGAVQGEVTLQPGGKFNFSFKPRIFGKSSKYYCSAKWIGSNLQWFDVWSKGRDGKAGRFIKWTVTEKEACRFDAAGSYSICVVFKKIS